MSLMHPQALVGRQTSRGAGPGPPHLPTQLSKGAAGNVNVSKVPQVILISSQPG